ncbi:MAG: aldehyde dehydrogenase family protein, partial [Deltaproteobacteria bacterium]
EQRRPVSAPGFSGRGVFPTVDAAIEAARKAFEQLHECSLKQRDAMIAEIRRRCTDAVETLARMANQETGLGRVEDKIKKNLLVIRKTPGIEDFAPWAKSGDDGLTIEEHAPFGVIGSITPTTNPSETIICNGIGILAGGNTVTFNVHPGARQVSAFTVSLMNDAVVAAGGPENVFTMVEHSTIESAQALMKHPGIALLVVTGGPGVVKAAMASGKKVIAGGPGNPPVLVDETAEIRRAAEGIVLGASFDNNIICSDEKEVFVVDDVADMLKKAMRDLPAIEINRNQARRLEKILIEDGHPNKSFIGKNANVLLERIGIRADDSLRLVFVETDFDHPFVQLEMLMPIIPIVRVRDADEGIALARKAEHGFGHTSVIYSTNIRNMHVMARTMNTCIFVKNAPA